MAGYDQEKAWSDFRVGLITFAAFSLLVLGVTFAGGDKGLLFKKTSVVRAWLADVGGLKRGSSVTMGGMTVGKVTDITLGHGSKRSQIEVTMEIRSDVRARIKTDSLPSVRTQGMLGDRYIDISMGNGKSGVLPEKRPLVGKAASDFDTTLRQASDVLNETQQLLNAINEKQGTVGQFFYDERFYDRLLEITSELNELIKDFKKNPKRYVKLSIF